MNIKVDFNELKLQSTLNAISTRAQRKLDAQVLKDSNKYCPIDTSMLQKSAINSTVLGSGVLVWSTPYAKKQYYDVPTSAHINSTNPQATQRWFETAKAIRHEEWVKLVENEYH